MEILPPIRKNMMEPRVYALLVKTKQGQVLHLGVHFSLDEAYSAARTKLEGLHPEVASDAVDIDLWNSIPAKKIIPQLLDIFQAEMTTEERALIDPKMMPKIEIPASEIDNLPNILRDIINNGNTVVKEEMKITTDEYVQGLKDMKNDLMKKLIEEANIVKVEEVKAILGAKSYKYVMNAIRKNALAINNEIRP